MGNIIQRQERQAVHHYGAGGRVLVGPVHNANIVREDYIRRRHDSRRIRRRSHQDDPLYYHTSRRSRQRPQINVLYSHNQPQLGSPSMADSSIIQKVSEMKEHVVNDVESSDTSEHDNCAICLCDFKEPKTIKCGHVFCGPCITGWMQTELKNSKESKCELRHLCPLCKCQHW